jgi:magnesium chelatase family protein
MLARLQTFSLFGIEAIPVDVEVDVSGGALPATVLVGMADTAIRESTHRVARAMVNSGFNRPNDRIVVNLAPAELPKQAATFDLPITLGILAGSGQVSTERLADYAVVGELSLEGSTRPARGTLSIAMAAARQNREREGRRLKGIVVPTASATEAAVVEDIDVIPVASLTEAVRFFAGELHIPPAPPRVSEWFDRFATYDVDFADVRGQEAAKRAICVAAAGGHNIAMVGPPGGGKTMLAKRIPTILPPLSAQESIETTRIYSALGLMQPGQPLLATRPFRAPHHTISEAGLVGGRSIPMPGEISLAHNGVLFLDELPEFQRRTLEVMRQPLEEGAVTISGLVVDHEDPAHAVVSRPGGSTAVSGRRIANRVRPSGRDQASVPPCCSATARTTARPRPTPSGLPVTNGSASVAARSAGGPGPSSSTTSARPGGAGSTEIRTCPPRPAASIALRARLTSAARRPSRRPTSRVPHGTAPTSRTPA